VRFLAEPTAEEFPDYIAVCTIVERENSEVELHGLLGKVKRAHLKALKGWLKTIGIERVLSHRVSGSRLPFSRGTGDWQIMDV